MKTRSLLVPLACLSLANLCSAEIFILKDGSRLDAKILKQTPEAYFLEVQITKSIKDERTVAKTDVKEIEVEKPDEKAFEKLKNLVPTPDLLTNDDYDKRIVPIVNFLKLYPKGPYADKANEMLTTLKTEGTAILGGGIKLGGTLISGDDYKANAYEIDARILESRIRDAAGRGDLVGALRGITRLDASYKSTASVAAIAPVRRQVLQAYRAQIAEQLTSYDARDADRNANLARMSGEDRRRTSEALAEEMAAFEKQYQAEKTADQTWIITNPFHKESLEAAAEAIQSESNNERATTPPAGDGGKAYRDALAFIKGSTDVDAIREAIEKTSNFEFPEKYTKNLQDAAKAKGVTF
jgi:TolA-binding protein